ncbi:hypothetical protein RJ639_044879 [Escallonia herrerae]|uniref:Uncharacterized protein n=1 Tax=Escallonia herrerae TaxID=1293975 RepID=A0AA88WGE4_9ASTE|nr:hypothetical protein RJ639_044879 [Escallonia herrerae]
MDVEIISKKNIKPASPTPLHLRSYSLSAWDNFPHMYVPGVLFYLNNNKDITPINFFPIISSDTLTRYYPFARKVNDDLSYIDCNDEGVYYVETKVSYDLKEFLSQPDVQLIQQLTPNNPRPLESMSGNYVILVQVNIFHYDVIIISTCTSHKLVDAAIFGAFMNAWSQAAARDSLDVGLNLSFIAPSSLPPNSTYLCKWPFRASGKSEYVTRRFIFHGTSLVALRAKAASISLVQYPISVEAVALFWICIKLVFMTLTLDKESPRGTFFAIQKTLHEWMKSFGQLGVIEEELGDVVVDEFGDAKVEPAGEFVAVDS